MAQDSPVEEINDLPRNQSRRMQIIARARTHGLGPAVISLCCRASYAYRIASSGGESNTPQNGIRIPSTIGVKIDAHMGTFAIRFIRYGWRKNPSIITITA